MSQSEEQIPLAMHMLASIRNLPWSNLPCVKIDGTQYSPYGLQTYFGNWFIYRIKINLGLELETERDDSSIFRES